MWRSSYTMNEPYHPVMVHRWSVDYRPRWSADQDMAVVWLYTRCLYTGPTFGQIVIPFHPTHPVEESRATFLITIETIVVSGKTPGPGEYRDGGEGRWDGGRGGGGGVGRKWVGRSYGVPVDVC
jgi:hypothetical protein